MNRKCFAYQAHGCAALRENLCETRESCPFFKTQEQEEADREAAMKRADAKAAHKEV